MSGAPRPVRKSPDFVERLAVLAIVGFASDGSLFIIDFLKPSMELLADEKGRIAGHRGELEVTARIFLPPATAKRLLMALGEVVRRYEEQFGEIKVETPASQGSVKGG